MSERRSNLPTVALLLLVVSVAAAQPPPAPPYPPAPPPRTAPPTPPASPPRYYYPPPVAIEPAPPPLSPLMRVIYGPFYAAGLLIRYGFYYGIVAPLEVFGRALNYGVEGGASKGDD